MSQIVLIQCDQGCELEAEFVRCRAAQFPSLGVLLLHPYSLLGGNMHDHVVSEFFRQAVASGLFGVVLRYNQRGCGRSSGRRLSLRNLRGEGDAADVASIADFLFSELPGDTDTPKRIVVIGYSFGAHLGAQILQDSRVAAYVGVSYPLGGLAGLLKTKEGFEKVKEATKIPRLLVLGAQDEYTKVAAMDKALREGGRTVAVADRGERGGAAGGANGPELKVYDDNGHFWATDCALMAENTLAWVAVAVGSGQG